MSTFKVKDMSCGHCEKVIKEQLSRENSSVHVEVNIHNKTVRVQNLSDDRVFFILKEIGYTSEKVK